jgi:hypothetical protein
VTHYDFTNIPAAFVQVIYQALGELPLKIAGPVFSQLDMQKREQDQQRESEAKP